MNSRSRAASGARSVRSIAESQIGLVASNNSIRMASLDGNHGRAEKSIRAARSKEAAYITAAPVKEYKGATMPANHGNRGEASFDIIIAALALYFVAFAILAYHQDGTMASLPLNKIIIRMAAFNPTAFPILFVFISGKFLKSFATFKLERGAVIGTIQHLLGSRTLVNAFLTPLKMGMMNFVVLGVFFFWCLNPLGGQMSLRTVSVDSNYTTISMNFHYLDINQSPYTLLNAPARLPPINSAYIASLFSPVSSKNGTQDMFGNVHIPTIESLQDSQIPDSDGWYRTGQLAQSNASSKELPSLEEFLGLSNDAVQGELTSKVVQSSLIGVPVARGGPVILPGYGVNVTETEDNIQATLSDIQTSLFGPEADEVVNIETQFNIETSYFSVNCSISPNGSANDPNELPTGMDAIKGIVSNNNGFTIQYDFNHTMNSTAPRQLNVTSWSGDSGNSGDITRASCDLTTTYVEASVYCPNGNNCSIQAMRPSALDHAPSILSQLDGIAPPYNGSKQAERRAIPQLFFSGFINATGNITGETYGPTPTECYFVNPENPFACSTGDTDNALHKIGDELFSNRFTQLMNTYWMDNVAPYSVTGNFTLNNPIEGSKSATTPGQIRVETKVLRCHIPFMVILVIISIILFLLGLATAYLDFQRRGPDIIDDFVTTLRHSPYAHVNEGLSMEDGFEKARRLRHTLVRLGDVQPDNSVGYIAIGTPSEGQPVRMLQHDRRYR